MQIYDALMENKLKAMKKKMLFIALLAILGLGSAVAQDINGRWKADEALKKVMDLKDKDLDMDIVLHFSGNALTIDLPMKGKDDEMTMSLVYSVPGTYTQTGNQVKAKFNTKKASLSVTDLQTNDPEMKAMMKTPEGKKAVLLLINSQVKESMAKDLKDLAEVTKVFESFTIEKVTATALTIRMMSEQTATFVRTK